MRQCYIDNGRHGCDGQRNNKGKIRYGCWACPHLDADNASKEPKRKQT